MKRLRLHPMTMLVLCLIVTTAMNQPAARSRAQSGTSATPCATGAATPSRRACASYTEGMSDLSNNDPAAAEKAFNAALQADPAFIAAWYGRATARYALHHFRAAQVDMLHVIARDRGLHREYYNTSAALQAALSLPQNVANDAYIGALVGIIIGDNPGALKLLNTALTANPRLVDAYHFRGNIYDDMGDRPHAEMDYQHALALDPHSFGTLYAYGYLRGEEGDYHGERDFMTRAIAVQPAAAEAWVARGIARQNLGDSTGAMSDETHALQIDPQSTDAWIDRADFENDAHQYQHAIADATQAIHLGQVPAAYLARAFARRARGDAQGAYDDATAAITLVPTYEAAYIDRGGASGDLHHWSAALADAQTAMQLDPSDAAGFNLAGWALINLNKPREALHYLDQALALDPSFVVALGNRCEARALAGDYTGSLDDCTQVIARDPHSAFAYLDRGIDHYYLADWPRARADLQIALTLFTQSGNAEGIRLARSWLARVAAKP